MHKSNSGLAAFGWSNHFQAQLTGDGDGALLPVRVSAVHRNGLDAVAPGFSDRIHSFFGKGDEDQVTVGDWLLLEQPSLRPVRLLERRSLFKRRSAGTGRGLQLIAANVDVLFIVSSCNQDFNIARLERYLALAREADVMPIVVLTKADLADDTGSFDIAARAIMPGLLVECLNALDPAEVAVLEPWCADGKTIALLGSSGVGKSTLANTLLGEQKQATAAIREDDEKGRHTTTGSALLPLPSGGWLIDTPGMRELQITDLESGIDDVFADIGELAAECRFSDCRHESEPGCAVLQAIEAETLDRDRLERWRKLEAENRLNSRTLAESRARLRALGKLYRSIQREKRER